MGEYIKQTSDKMGGNTRKYSHEFFAELERENNANG